MSALDTSFVPDVVDFERREPSVLTSTDEKVSISPVPGEWKVWYEGNECVRGKRDSGYSYRTYRSHSITIVKIYCDGELVDDYFYNTLDRSLVRHDEKAYRSAVTISRGIRPFLRRLCS